MNEIDGYYVDDNNNKWYAKAFTKEEAIEHSRSLIDCKDCTNCQRCINCVRCKSCIDCIGCIRCTNCIDCDACIDCRLCKHCHNLEDKICKTLEIREKPVDSDTCPYCGGTGKYYD